MSQASEDAIAAYTPVSVSARAASFARETVAAARPRSRARAKALLWAASRLAGFGISVGLEPTAQALLREAVIERFIVLGTEGLRPSSVRTLRSNLRALGRANEAHPGPAPLARERAKPPYSRAEICGYLGAAAAQPTTARRHRASALVALGAGAGVIGAELRQLRGGDVVARSGGLVVSVGGRRARVVPLLARFEQPLSEAAAFAADGYLLGGRDPERKNLTDSLNRALGADRSLPRLQGGRLRSSWLVSCAELIGLRAFMDAAGVRCTQRLGDLVAELEPPSEADLVRLLGGADE